MAYKPSLRRHRKPEEMSLDIRPVMNLMVVLIPLLLAGSVFTRLAVKQLNLPPKTTGGAGAETDKPVELEKRLGLNVIISKKGFYIGSRSGFLQSDEQKTEEEGEGEPSVPLDENGNYDYNLLKAKLIEIKEKVVETDYVDKNTVLLTAEADIPYKYLIKTMDNVSVYENEEGELQELFPQIIIGQVVI
jgi:biopolymer transport protein ExbD